MKKALLIATALAVIGLVAAALYVESDAFGARLRPLIVDPLGKVLGPGSRVGRVKATLVPLVLEVRDVSVPAGRSVEAITVRKVRAYINPLPLLWKRISISSITVLEPRVAATRGRDGNIDIISFLQALQGDREALQEPGPSSYAISVRSVSIENGTLTVADEPSGARIGAASLDAKAILRSNATEGIVRISRGTLTIRLPNYPEWNGTVRTTIAFAGETFSLSDLEVRSREGQLAASGTFSTAPKGKMDLRIQTRIGMSALGALSRKLTTREKGVLFELAAKVTGSFEEPELKGTADLAGIPLKGFLLERVGIDFSYSRQGLRIEGRGGSLDREGQELRIEKFQMDAGYDRGSLRIHRAYLKADDTELETSGAISAHDGYDLALSISSSGTGKLLKFLSGKDVNGAFGLSGRLTGQLLSPTFDGTVSGGPITVRAVTFDGVIGTIAMRDRTVSLVGATIRQGGSRYLLDGSVSFKGQEPYFQAHLGIIRSDVVSIVALFYKPIPLDMSASGELNFTGTSSAFTGKGKLDLGAGAAYGESFEQASINVELTSGRVIFPQVRIEKGGGRIEGRGWIEFRGDYYANIESSGVDLSAVDHLRALSLQGPFDLTISSKGPFSEPQVKARGRAMSVHREELSLGPVQCDLLLQNGKLAVEGTIGNGDGNGAALTGTMDLSRPYAWTTAIDFHLAGADPSVLAKGNELLSKVRISANGRISLQGQISGERRISGNAVIRQTTIMIADHRIDNDGDVRLRLENDEVNVMNLVLIGTGTKLAITGSGRIGRDIDLSLAGEANLSLLRLLYREVEHGDGIATVRLTVREGWIHPHVEGRLTVQDGMIKVRDITQRFTAMNGTILFDRERITTEGLSADVGGGRITVIGSAQLQDAALYDFSARAVVNDVTVHYPAGLTATLGGTLYYEGDRREQSLSGEISIAKAKYEKRIEWKSMLVDITRGITRKKKTEIGWIGETRLNIHFLGSDNVLFESNLAKIPIKIDTLFQGTVNQVQLLGRIEAREGEVYFRNNVFHILYASADFVDPGRINPVLDVQAETKVREYRIRLAVAGNADRAVVTFLSDPPLEDADILALLALGRKGEELRGREEAVGAGESLSFVSGKFQDLLESRARSLTGLDRFQVDPYINRMDTAVPRVTVGKEVVENRLFMTYSSNVGGTTPEQNLRMEYILNRNVSFIGEYDDLGQIGADVKFRFEFR